LKENNGNYRDKLICPFIPNVKDEDFSLGEN